MQNEVPNWLKQSGGSIRHGAPVEGEIVRKPEATKLDELPKAKDANERKVEVDNG